CHFLRLQYAREHAHAVDPFIMPRVPRWKLQHEPDIMVASEPAKGRHYPAYVFARLIVGDMEEIGLSRWFIARREYVAVHPMVTHMNLFRRNIRELDGLVLHECGNRD